MATDEAIRRWARYLGREHPDQLAARLLAMADGTSRQKPADRRALLREAARRVYPQGDPVWRHVPYEEAP